MPDRKLSTQAISINRVALDHYRDLFVACYPDFKNFQQREGGYFTEERQYKEQLMGLAQTALLNTSEDQELGTRLLDILMGKAGAYSNLLGWRTNSRIVEIRERHPGVLEKAAGRLARADDFEIAIDAFVDRSWPRLAEGQASKPYSENRSIPSMLAALIHPDKAYGINTDPVQRTAQALFGRKLFGWNRMTAQEYSGVLAMARAIWDVMADEWEWAPRDLWDVQGFIWTINQSDRSAHSVDQSFQLANDRRSPMSVNLIFYGPPGTGKTYQTAVEAVDLCGEPVPADREQLMEAYHRLMNAGRIEFVTFHQSTSYEDFVECLRPRLRGDGEPGFELRAEPGVFRRIAQHADTRSGDFSLDGRQVFKMSIGEAANAGDAHLFDEAIEGGYALLGYDDIDWTDPRFADRTAILEAVNAHNAIEGDPQKSGRVQMPFVFRNCVRAGDLLIISKGNSYFRAIGVVVGDYQFVPRKDGGGYAHRRAVRWLWQNPNGERVDKIYKRSFTMKSIYLLAHDDLIVPTLERYIASQQGAGTGASKQFVLIIDEINRANISKVFGELITLLEPDKRIGQPNELKVRLPYSRDVLGVPANLHIIGTMNTADRSIALLDTALRRRFQFRELMPDPSALGIVDGIDLPKLLSTLNERIEYLFDREHQIGHAYFMDCKTRAEIDEVMRHKVIPLLCEYFYDDWSKVAAVLGDGDDREGCFMDRRKLEAPEGMGGDDDAAPRYRWRIRENFSYEAFMADDPVHSL